MTNRIALTCAFGIALTATGIVQAGADGKATEILAAARKAIGDKKLDTLRSLALEASVQRNVNTMQMASDVEILVELPDKYLRSDVSSGPMSMTISSGFVGEKVIRPANASSMAGGMMVIRMGPGGPARWSNTHTGRPDCTCRTTGGRAAASRSAQASARNSRLISATASTWRRAEA